MVKLLSPVSSFEAAVKVIAAGADEIYCGVAIPDVKYPGLSTRQRECSLPSYDELGRVTKYAHDHGVKTIVTPEFPFFSEVVEEEVKKHIQSCVHKDIDAIIATDIGVVLAMQEMNVDTAIYASTYNAAMNYEAVKFLKDIGVKRVILERQVALDEIPEIVKRNRDVEIEVFIHGPGCSNINVSCYGCFIPKSFFGAMARARITFKLLRKESSRRYLQRLAENRVGIVLGPLCRLTYEIDEVDGEERRERGYAPILDAYSFCSLCKLPALVKTGVAGLKIVGRCTSPIHQEAATKAYRELVDLIVGGHLTRFQEKLKQTIKEMGSWLESVGIEFNPCEEERCYYAPFFHVPYIGSIPLDTYQGNEMR